MPAEKPQMAAAKEISEFIATKEQSIETQRSTLALKSGFMLRSI
jgi:hypothetical protein